MSRKRKCVDLMLLFIFSFFIVYQTVNTKYLEKDIDELEYPVEDYVGDTDAFWKSHAEQTIYKSEPILLPIYIKGVEYKLTPLINNAISEE